LQDWLRTVQEYIHRVQVKWWAIFANMIKSFRVVSADHAKKIRKYGSATWALPVTLMQCFNL